MALKPTYLAAEHSASERRSRALHRFIVASPVLLLLAVGLVGHLRRRPYVGSASSSEFDRRVLAYRERVVAVQALPTLEFPPLVPYVEEGRRWVAGFETGSLTPLAPVAYEDHLRDGVRGEVFRAGLSLASALALASSHRLESGHPDEAARVALVAARVAYGLKSFELQACLQAMLVQRRSIGIVARAWPALPPTEREEIRTSLTKLRVDPKGIDQLSALEDNQLRDYCRRQKISFAEIREDASGLGDQAIAAIRRSVRMNNERVDALLKGDKARTSMEELP